MKRYLLTLGLITIASVTTVAAGCSVTARTPTVSVASSYGGWSPQYYHGSLIYYTSSGSPYYYNSGSIVYVPSTWANYGVTVNHWQTNRAAYGRWHGRYHAPRYYTRARPAKARRHPAQFDRNHNRAPGHRPMRTRNQVRKNKN